MKLTDWLTEHITDDPRALGWFDSPEAEDRITRCYKELLNGYDIDPSTILKTTRMLGPDESRSAVEVRDIAFYSICAHHFLPFFGHVSVRYVPGDRILGLGKLPRLVEAYARRFQIQEDLVQIPGTALDFRVLVDTILQGDCLRQARANESDAAREPVGQTPVSYTHLTLPTILLV